MLLVPTYFRIKQCSGQAKALGAAALPAQTVQEHPWGRGLLQLYGKRVLALKAALCGCACAFMCAGVYLRVRLRAQLPSSCPLPASAAIYCTAWPGQAAAGIARREASPSRISPQSVCQPRNFDSFVGEFLPRRRKNPAGGEEGRCRELGCAAARRELPLQRPGKSSRAASQPLPRGTLQPKLARFSHEITHATGIAPGRCTGEPSGSQATLGGAPSPLLPCFSTFPLPARIEPAPEGDQQLDPPALLGGPCSGRGLAEGPSKPLHPPAATSPQHPAPTFLRRASFRNILQTAFILHPVLVGLMEGKKPPIF